MYQQSILGSGAADGAVRPQISARRSGAAALLKMRPRRCASAAQLALLKGNRFRQITPHAARCAGASARGSGGAARVQAPPHAARSVGESARGPGAASARANASARGALRSQIRVRFAGRRESGRTSPSAGLRVAKRARGSGDVARPAGRLRPRGSAFAPGGVARLGELLRTRGSAFANPPAVPEPSRVPAASRVWADFSVRGAVRSQIRTRFRSRRASGWTSPSTGLCGRKSARGCGQSRVRADASVRGASPR
jgi:hypothetical protein